MPSDVLMFERSGTSIAMANASAEVQHAAMFVTSSNMEEGFALAIERLFYERPSREARSANGQPRKFENAEGLMKYRLLERHIRDRACEGPQHLE